MAEPWIGIVNTIAPRYIKEAIDLTRRNQIWLPMLERRKGIEFGLTGWKIYWTTQYREQPVTAYTDGLGADYQPQDIYKPASMDVRGYHALDKMSEEEKLSYADDVGIVNRYKRILVTATASLRKKLGLAIYGDGNAAGRELEYHGIGSFTAADLNKTTDDDLIAYPSDTYAGISTTPGQADTNWSTDLAAASRPNAALATDFPEGYGAVGYDYWTPLLLNTAGKWGATDTAGTASREWIDSCEFCLRRAVQWLHQNAAMDRPSLMCLMAGNMFAQLKDHFTNRLRIPLPPALPEAVELGFPETLSFEGCGVKSEWGTPAGTANIFNMEKMKLRVRGKELVMQQGPEWSQLVLAYLFRVANYGNIQFESPKFFAHLENYSAQN